MGTTLKEYMNMEEADFTLPPESTLPCASDSPTERHERMAARRLHYDEQMDGNGNVARTRTK